MFNPEHLLYDYEYLFKYQTDHLLFNLHLNQHNNRLKLANVLHGIDESKNQTNEDLPLPGPMVYSPRDLLAHRGGHAVSFPSCVVDPAAFSDCGTHH